MKFILSIIFFFVFLLTFFQYDDAFGTTEPILITISPEMEEVLFDGKWTYFSEWKPSSLTTISQDSKQVILRSAHYENYIYIFVDSIDDFTLDKGIDKATICFDGKNEKSKIADENDFCFTSTLGNNNGVVFQGGSTNANNGHFKKITNPEDFIAISTVSDENDRYTKSPHPSFEFKIPIEIIKRSDNYGIFLSVYDGSTETFYTFPDEAKRDNLLKIPSPQTWGDIISPDKSLPELHFPLLIFAVLFFAIILFQSKQKLGIFPKY